MVRKRESRQFTALLVAMWLKPYGIYIGQVLAYIFNKIIMSFTFIENIKIAAVFIILKSECSDSVYKYSLILLLSIFNCLEKLITTRNTNFYKLLV